MLALATVALCPRYKPTWTCCGIFLPKLSFLDEETPNRLVDHHAVHRGIHNDSGKYRRRVVVMFQGPNSKGARQSQTHEREGLVTQTSDW